MGKVATGKKVTVKKRVAKRSVNIKKQVVKSQLNTLKAIEAIEKRIDRADKLMKRRQSSAVSRDRLTTHKKTSDISDNKAWGRWRKDQGTSDIRGIDTKDFSRERRNLRSRLNRAIRKLQPEKAKVSKRKPIKISKPKPIKKIIKKPKQPPKIIVTKEKRAGLLGFLPSILPGRKPKIKQELTEDLVNTTIVKQYKPLMQFTKSEDLIKELNKETGISKKDVEKFLVQMYFDKDLNLMTGKGKGIKVDKTSFAFVDVRQKPRKALKQKEIVIVEGEPEPEPEPEKKEVTAYSKVDIPETISTEFLEEMLKQEEAELAEQEKIAKTITELADTPTMLEQDRILLLKNIDRVGQSGTVEEIEKLLEGQEFTVTELRDMENFPRQLYYKQKISDVLSIKDREERFESASKLQDEIEHTAGGTYAWASPLAEVKITYVREERKKELEKAQQAEPIFKPGKLPPLKKLSAYSQAIKGMSRDERRKYDLKRKLFKEGVISDISDASADDKVDEVYDSHSPMFELYEDALSKFDTSEKKRDEIIVENDQAIERFLSLDEDDQIKDLEEDAKIIHQVPVSSWSEDPSKSDVKDLDTKVDNPEEQLILLKLELDQLRDVESTQRQIDAVLREITRLENLEQKPPDYNERIQNLEQERELLRGVIEPISEPIATQVSKEQIMLTLRTLTQEKKEESKMEMFGNPPINFNDLVPRLIADYNLAELELDQFEKDIWDLMDSEVIDGQDGVSKYKIISQRALVAFVSIPREKETIVPVVEDKIIETKKDESLYINKQVQRLKFLSVDVVDLEETLKEIENQSEEIDEDDRIDIFSNIGEANADKLINVMEKSKDLGVEISDQDYNIDANFTTFNDLQDLLQEVNKGIQERQEHYKNDQKDFVQVREQEKEQAEQKRIEKEQVEKELEEERKERETEILKGKIDKFRELRDEIQALGLSIPPVFTEGAVDDDVLNELADILQKAKEALPAEEKPESKTKEINKLSEDIKEDRFRFSDDLFFLPDTDPNKRIIVRATPQEETIRLDAILVPSFQLTNKTADLDGYVTSQIDRGVGLYEWVDDTTDIKTFIESRGATITEIRDNNYIIAMRVDDDLRINLALSDGKQLLNSIDFGENNMRHKIDKILSGERKHPILSLADYEDLTRLEEQLSPTLVKIEKELENLERLDRQRRIGIVIQYPNENQKELVEAYRSLKSHHTTLSFLKEEDKELLAKKFGSIRPKQAHKVQFNINEPKQTGFLLNDYYVVRWTGNYQQNEAIAELVKINPRSIKVKIVESLDGTPKMKGIITILLGKTTNKNAIFEIRNKEIVDEYTIDLVNVMISDTEYKDRRIIKQVSRQGNGGVTWDRDNKTWRGKVEREYWDELAKYGTVEEDKEFTFEEKVQSIETGQERKIEKLEKQLENIKKKYDEVSDYLRNSPEAQFLGMAEPIKIGHHSEKRHRKLIEKFRSRSDKQHEFYNKIKEIEFKIEVAKNQLERKGSIIQHQRKIPGKTSPLPPTFEAEAQTYQDVQNDKVTHHFYAQKGTKTIEYQGSTILNEQFNEVPYEISIPEIKQRYGWDVSHPDLEIVDNIEDKFKPITRSMFGIDTDNLKVGDVIVPYIGGNEATITKVNRKTVVGHYANGDEGLWEKKYIHSKVEK